MQYCTLVITEKANSSGVCDLCWEVTWDETRPGLTEVSFVEILHQTKKMTVHCLTVGLDRYRRHHFNSLLTNMPSFNPTHTGLLTMSLKGKQINPLITVSQSAF